MTSPKSSPLSPGEAAANEQRSLPSTQPIIEEEVTERNSPPPASARPGTEAGDPATQGTVCFIMSDLPLYNV